MNWSKVTVYLTQHSACQKMQGVRKQVWYTISLLQPNDFPKSPVVRIAGPLLIHG